MEMGEVVAILGHNGAGKTTLLKSIAGLMQPRGGAIEFNGIDVTGRAVAENVKDGLVFSPASSAVFSELSVRENLELGAFVQPDPAFRRERLSYVFGMFPVLEQRQSQAAGTLSGGERRMLSFGIALMARPQLVLLDEPSNGLAPAMADRFFRQVRALVNDGELSVVLVEQNVSAALRIADRAYFIRGGRVILEESAATALARGRWWDLF